MTFLQKHHGQMSDSMLTAFFIILSGGLQDAYTYCCRGKVFANAQTGNIVLLSTHLFEGDWGQALRYLVPVLAFLLGIYIAECVHRHFKRMEKVHWRQLIILAEIVLLAAVGFRSDQDISMEVRSHRTAGLSDVRTGQRPQGEPGDPAGCDIREVQVRGRDARLYQFRHLPDEARSVSVYSVLFYLDSPDSDAAPFYSVSIPEQGRLLVWADEEAGQVFLLFGTLGQKELCRMAESMYEEGNRS